MAYTDTLPVAPAVNREPDPNDIDESSVIGTLLDAYRQQGYERGYQQATRDVLASLVTVTEAYLRSRPGDAPDRRELYAFVEFLEHRLEASAANAGYVTGGLGI